MEDQADLYHITCSGSTSWCGFAQAVFDRTGKLLNGKVPVVVQILPAQYPTPAPRPRNSILSNARHPARFGVRLAPCEAAAQEPYSKKGEGEMGGQVGWQQFSCCISNAIIRA
jgi:dTDP-4-dehydrorhamnose reductase